MPNHFYTRCRNVLLRCEEFDTNAKLGAIFITEKLYPFRSGLPEATNRNERVDLCLSYLRQKRHSSGEAIFPIFLEVLRDRYPEGDALREELTKCLEEAKQIWKTEKSSLPPSQEIVNPSISPEEEFEYEIEEQPWYAPNLPETQEIDENQCQLLKQEIDVVIITATDVELKAVAKLLKPYPKRKKVLLAYVGPETYYLGKFGEYNTVVTKCRMGSIGEGSVILATEQAQRLWSPKVVIMVGIAFGKDPNKQNIADVLVASQIISYEQQRLGEEIVYRGSIPPSNTTLLNRFENVQNWKFARPDGSHCSLIIGAVLSGEKLVDNPNFKAQLFKQFPQAVGGEMEGAGLCAASGRVGTAWILVKSICDWGDGKKHKKYQPLAAASAASLVHYVLSQKTVLNSIQKPGGK
ncbi:5'-methylthioadenosine/S-adenosylhomocysteine nucleosidase family protein [Scytonema sp. NUACC21]